MIADFRGKAVLVTGGTMGIGLATGLAFGRRGAQCYLTYKWGSADEDEVRGAFADAGAPEPRLVRADVSVDEDLEPLLDEIDREHGSVEVLVGNVSFSLVTNDLEDYRKRSLFKSIEYSAWPLFSYLEAIHARFGRYPRYALGISSYGPDRFHVGYDFAASSKAVMETLCRYASCRLNDEDCRINVLRTGGVWTASLDATFGSEFRKWSTRLTKEGHFLTPDLIGNTAVALCSGLMDGVRGQVLTVDRGTTFFDNLMRIYDERETLRL